MAVSENTGAAAETLTGGGTEDALNTAIATGDTVYQIGPDPVWSGRSLSVTSPPIDETGRGVGYICTAKETGGGAQR